VGFDRNGTRRDGGDMLRMTMTGVLLCSRPGSRRRPRRRPSGAREGPMLGQREEGTAVTCRERAWSNHQPAAVPCQWTRSSPKGRTTYVPTDGTRGPAVAGRESSGCALLNVLAESTTGGTRWLPGDPGGRAAGTDRIGGSSPVGRGVRGRGQSGDTAMRVGTAVVKPHQATTTRTTSPARDRQWPDPIAIRRPLRQPPSPIDRLPVHRRTRSRLAGLRLVVPGAKWRKRGGSGCGAGGW
jgi:hypothetical protein